MNSNVSEVKCKRKTTEETLLHQNPPPTKSAASEQSMSNTHFQDDGRGWSFSCFASSPQLLHSSWAKAAFTCWLWADKELTFSAQGTGNFLTASVILSSPSRTVLAFYAAVLRHSRHALLLHGVQCLTWWVKERLRVCGYDPSCSDCHALIVCACLLMFFGSWRDCVGGKRSCIWHVMQAQEKEKCSFSDWLCICVFDVHTFFHLRRTWERRFKTQPDPSKNVDSWNNFRFACQCRENWHR